MDSDCLCASHFLIPMGIDLPNYSTVIHGVSSDYERFKN